MFEFWGLKTGQASRGGTEEQRYCPCDHRLMEEQASSTRNGAKLQHCVKAAYGNRRDCVAWQRLICI